MCKHLNIKSNVILEEEYKYKSNETNQSKTSINSTLHSTEKFVPSKITPSLEKHAQKG